MCLGPEPVRLTHRRALIDYVIQIQAVGRRRRPASLAVTCRECYIHVILAPLALANQFQNTNHVADLMMEKRARPSGDDDFITVARARQCV